MAGITFHPFSSHSHYFTHHLITFIPSALTHITSPPHHSHYFTHHLITFIPSALTHITSPPHLSHYFTSPLTSLHHLITHFTSPSHHSLHFTTSSLPFCPFSPHSYHFTHHIITHITSPTTPHHSLSASSHFLLHNEYNNITPIPLHITSNLSLLISNITPRSSQLPSYTLSLTLL
ncbi:hypothetical protein Pmani_007806 [Petrolisthes manimaculis]|uniref:Uncharacterized protein n=1 Tax=Petrolisthes manimaculis TaxID=1843537 RepID=A0AAE1Q9X3_9EUCA|nr:hypothetical protein Pmani_007806 [Petrolisthes manimaculis]